MCGKSRLYGGIHFDAAVPAGSNICSDLVDSIVNLLRRGDPAGSMADKDDTSILRVVSKTSTGVVDKDDLQPF
jgi:hypothetical protein